MIFLVFVFNHQHRDRIKIRKLKMNTSKQVENVTFTFSNYTSCENRGPIECSLNVFNVFISLIERRVFRFSRHSQCRALNRMGLIIFVWHEPKIDMKNIIKPTKYLSHTLNVSDWCRNKDTLLMGAGQLCSLHCIFASTLVSHIYQIFLFERWEKISQKFEKC